MWRLARGVPIGRGSRGGSANQQGARSRVCDRRIRVLAVTAGRRQHDDGGAGPAVIVHAGVSVAMVTADRQRRRILGGEDAVRHQHVLAADPPRRADPDSERLGKQEVEGESPERERPEGRAGGEQVGSRQALDDFPCQMLRRRGQKKDGSSGAYRAGPARWPPASGRMGPSGYVRGDTGDRDGSRHGAATLPSRGRRPSPVSAPRARRGGPRSERASDAPA